MYCSKCGAALKDDARFCAKCGAPVGNSSAGDIDDDEAKAEPASPAESVGQVEPDQKRSGRKVTPLMVLVIALAIALAAGAAVAVYRIAANPNQTPESSQQTQQSEAAQQTQQSEQQAKELTPEEKVIKSLDGWWQIGRVWKQDHLLNFHDGTMDVYSNEGEFQRTSRTITPNDLLRADDGLGERHFGGPGYFIYAVNRDDYGFYLADDMPDTLHQVKSDGSGYSGGDSYARINPPSWASSVSEGATEVETEPFDQVKAESEARAAAEAAGKTVLEGTVFIGKESDWAQKEGLPRAPNPDSRITYAGLILDESVTVNAQNADGATIKERPYVERSGEYVMLASSSRGNEVDRWAPYDGQRVSVAFSDFRAFSDSVGVLFAFRGTGERIAPLTESDVVVSTSDYILPDSATREYSESELRAMDVHTLFLARNEIYARHGRQFKSEELQRYFGSKSWYSGTVPPDSFSEGVLNAVEKANVSRMYAIEESMGSPYI